MEGYGSIGEWRYDSIGEWRYGSISEWVWDLGWEALLNVFLHPAEEEWLQLLMEGAERVCVSLSIGSVSGLKLLPVWEGPWHYEMEQGPQLLQRILRDMGLCERDRDRERVDTIPQTTHSPVTIMLG